MQRAILTLAATLIGTSAHAGWSGNGGDMSKDQNNPWFLATEADEVVEYCVLRSADFPFERAELQEMVRLVIDEWRAFFHGYGIDAITLGADPMDGQFQDRRTRRLALRWQEVPLCDEPDTQVQFAFGVETPIVQDYLAVGNHHSLGAALRGPYNHQTFWTGGTIWLTPKTSSGESWITYPEYLKHQLLHELGHVFGMKHNSVFVMDERIADVLTIAWYTEHFRNVLGHIEEPSWPYRIKTGMVLDLHAGHYLPEELSVAGWLYNAKLPESFKRLLGMEPQRDIHRFRLRVDALRPDGEPSDLTLIVEQRDHGGRWEFHGDDFRRTYSGRTQPSGYWLHSEHWEPGVYTDWLYTQDSDTWVWSFFKTLDHDNEQFRDWPLPMTGSFMYEGQRFAATIDRSHRGLVFRMMEPTTGEWIEVVSPSFIMQLGPK